MVKYLLSTIKVETLTCKVRVKVLPVTEEEGDLVITSIKCIGFTGPKRLNRLIGPTYPNRREINHAVREIMITESKKIKRFI